jgi:hypothetical protein
MLKDKTMIKEHKKHAKFYKREAVKAVNINKINFAADKIKQMSVQLVQLNDKISKLAIH